MAIAQVHSGYAVELGLGSPVAIGGIQSASVESNSETRGEITDGGVHPVFQSLVAQAPIASFTTMAIQAALDAFSLAGFNLNITDVPDGLDIFARKQKIGATRETTSVHRRYRIYHGVIVPRTLSVEQGGDATLPFDVVIYYDGTNNPVIVTDSIAIPATALTGDKERYGIGKINIGGTEIVGVRSVQIDFGLNVVAVTADGEIWPTFAHVQTQTPSVVITGIDVDWLRDNAGAGGAVDELGELLLRSNTDIWLRKRIDASTYELDAATVHPHFVISGMAVVGPYFSQSGPDPAEVTLTLPLRTEGANAPISYVVDAIV